MALKDREQQILNYMKEQVKLKGYPPTVREICKSLGIKSTSTVHKDIESLVKLGYLIKDPAKPRALMFVTEGHQNRQKSTSKTRSPQGSSSFAYEKNLTPVHSEVVEIPVIGQVAAGSPILAEENIDDTLPIPARFLGRGANYLLTVKGDSMIEAGIFDGDYILVQQQETARNGDIVVAMVDGFETEATVKTFYRERDHIRLQPENSSMSPILVKEVRILGKVCGVFRYF